VNYFAPAITVSPPHLIQRSAISIGSVASGRLRAIHKQKKKYFEPSAKTEEYLIAPLAKSSPSEEGVTLITDFVRKLFTPDSARKLSKALTGKQEMRFCPFPVKQLPGKKRPDFYLVPVMEGIPDFTRRFAVEVETTPWNPEQKVENLRKAREDGYVVFITRVEYMDELSKLLKPHSEQLGVKYTVVGLKLAPDELLEALDSLVGEEAEETGEVSEIGGVPGEEASVVASEESIGEQPDELLAGVEESHGTGEGWEGFIPVEAAEEVNPVEEAEEGEWVSPVFDDLPVPVDLLPGSGEEETPLPAPVPMEQLEHETPADRAYEPAESMETAVEGAESANNPPTPAQTTYEPSEPEEQPERQTEWLGTQEEQTETDTVVEAETPVEVEHVVEPVTEEPEATPQTPAPAAERGESHTSEVTSAHDPYEEIAKEYGIKSEEDLINALQVYIATMTTPPEPLRRLAVRWLWKEDPDKQEEELEDTTAGIAQEEPPLEEPETGMEPAQTPKSKKMVTAPDTGTGDQTNEIPDSTESHTAETREGTEDTAKPEGSPEKEEEDVEVIIYPDGEEDTIILRYPDVEARYRVLESATPLDYWKDTAEKLVSDPDSYSLRVVEKNKTEDGRPLPEEHPPLLVVLEIHKMRPVERFWRRIYFERAD